MKHTYLMGLALVALVLAPVAHAAGLAIRWNACFGDGGVSNRTFACNVNTGAESATASFVLASPLTGMVAAISTIEIATAGAAVPDWWRFAAGLGNCRSGQLSTNPTISGSAVTCQDWTQGTGAGGISNYTVGTLGPSTATANSGQVIAQGVNVLASQEYFTFNLVLRNLNTTGTGACAGCTVPACIAFSHMEIDLSGVPGFPDLVLNAPLNGTDANFITWQGGVGAGPLPGGICPAATPTRNSTWGGVKSLYR